MNKLIKRQVCYVINGPKFLYHSIYKNFIINGYKNLFTKQKKKKK